MRHIALIAALLITPAYADSDWPDSALSRYFKSLLRPDRHLKHNETGPISCCGAGDVVKTKFKVEVGNNAHPEDAWFAWLKGKWVRIPPEKIVADFAPDGQAYLFMPQIVGYFGEIYDGDIVCFVRPKGGL
jgi:hypothetical protein